MRQDSPLKYWKFSPNDAKVIDKFEKQLNDEAKSYRIIIQKIEVL